MSEMTVSERDPRISTCTYRGVEIEHCEWKRLTNQYEFSLYPMFKQVGKENELGGSGWWSASSLDTAKQEIDRFLQRCGLDCVAPPQPWKPVAGADKLSISRADLVKQIRTLADARRIASAMNNPALQVMEGICLLSWQAESGPGCIRFGRFDDDGKLQCTVAAINAPPSKSAEFGVIPGCTMIFLG